MLATESEAITATTGSTVRVILSVLIGVLTGALIYYLTVLVVTTPIPGEYGVHPMMLALTAVVGALVVGVSWRWPVVGLTAGVVILAIAVIAIVGRLGWSSSSAPWLSPFDAVAVGALNGSPALIGGVAVALSALRLFSRRAG